MTKRRNSSPYPHPPTGFVRALMRAGWRRCDAEAIDVVRLSLAHAHDPKGARTWAVRAAKALRTEPVLLGAIDRLVDGDQVGVAALRLLIVAPEDQRDGLARLAHAAIKVPLVERLLEQRYLESVEADDMDEALG